MIRRTQILQDRVIYTVGGAFKVIRLCGCASGSRYLDGKDSLGMRQV